MGAGPSKQASRSAAAAGRRQYPSTSSILNNAPSTSNAPSHATPPSQSIPPQASQVHPSPVTEPPSDTKSSHIDLDGRDPQFGASLRRLGPAISVERAAPDKAAFPTSSQPPLGQQGANIFPDYARARNRGLSVIDARKRVQEVFERESEEMGRASFGGRTLLSAKEIRELIRLRDEGKEEGEIERQLRLGRGVVATLGEKGVFENVRL